MGMLGRITSWLVACCLAALLSACGTKYQGPASDHFDGKVFFNPGQIKESSVLGYLWLRLTSSQATWPSSVPLSNEPAPPAQVNDGSARVTLIGHATVLIQVAGLNIVTDPVWSDRASPLSFAGPKRVASPSLALQALPRIDLVLISHDHYDHLDVATLRELDARDKPRVIVPLGNLALVQKTMPASKVSEHDWGDKVQIASTGRQATIHLEPMLHGSGRSPFDQMQTLWAAFVIEAAGLKIYHVGDTGYGDGKNFRDAASKHSGFDLAILPIGAYEPASFMKDSHMRPSDAVKALLDAQAKRGMAHHFEAFQLGFEGFDAPREELLAAMAANKLPLDRFAIPKPGQAVVVPAR